MQTWIIFVSGAEVKVTLTVVRSRTGHIEHYLHLNVCGIGWLGLDTLPVGVHGQAPQSQCPVETLGPPPSPSSCASDWGLHSLQSLLPKALQYRDVFKCITASRPRPSPHQFVPIGIQSIVPLNTLISVNCPLVALRQFLTFLFK